MNKNRVSTPLRTKSWEKPHRANATGTQAAYAPPGSLRTPETRPRVSGTSSSGINIFDR